MIDYNDTLTGIVYEFLQGDLFFLHIVRDVVAFEKMEDLALSSYVRQYLRNMVGRDEDSPTTIHIASANVVYAAHWSAALRTLLRVSLQLVDYDQIARWILEERDETQQRTA